MSFDIFNDVLILNVLWLRIKQSSNNLQQVTCDLNDTGGIHVEEDATRLEASPQLKQRVQGQRGNVGFRPPVTTFFDVFFKFYPSGMKN